MLLVNMPVTTELPVLHQKAYQIMLQVVFIVTLQMLILLLHQALNQVESQVIL